MSTFDHLDADELRVLLARAVAELSPARRRAVLGTMRTPPRNERAPSDASFAEIFGAIAALTTLMEDQSEDLFAHWRDDWYGDGEIGEDLEAAQDTLDEAIAHGAVWLATQGPSAGLIQRVDEVLGALDALDEWEIGGLGMSYGELDDRPAQADALRVWLFLANCRKERPATITAELVESWPEPTRPSMLAATLGARAPAVISALVKRADTGHVAAARWVVLDDPDALNHYKHLAPDLGAAWAVHMAQGARWTDIADATGVCVPAELLYRARMELGRHEEAFSGVLGEQGAPELHELWDEAVGVSALPLLRRVAAASKHEAALWIGLPEPTLLRLPAKYEHERIKAVVSYAVARLTKGAKTSAASAWSPSRELLARLATAAGAHNPKRCVETALEGLERLIAFHVAARSRNRYARAAAYWAEHGELATGHGLGVLHEGLRAHYADELRRLPALRDELKRARVMT